MKERPQRPLIEARNVVPVVTDETAPELLGMSGRAFREAVTRQRVPHVKLGARVIVTVETLQRISDAGTPLQTPVQCDIEPSVDDMLASIGHRRNGLAIEAQAAANASDSNESGGEKAAESAPRRAS